MRLRCGDRKGRHLRRPVCYAREDTRGRAAGVAARRLTRSLAWRPPIPARGRWLIGNAPVITAIGCPGVCLSTAEEEVGLARIADWPVALILVELEQRAALPDRDDVLD